MISKNFKELNRLSTITDYYDVFFVDLWGVVHNGIKLLPNILDVFENLKKKKKNVFFLTNAPRRSYVIRSQLQEFGINDFLYDDVISSGEITWQKLKNEENKFVNCYLIGPERDFHLIEGLKVNVVNVPERTDIIVNTGPWGDDDSLENYKLLLKKLVEHKPLMICSNPDKKVVRGENFMICAGLIAEYYEKIGGKVKYFGKPFNEIYEFCYKKIEKNKKILVIGDSLDNDIKGANNQKLDSLLITSGIHRDVNSNNFVDIKKLGDLINKKNISPKFYMRELKY